MYVNIGSKSTTKNLLQGKWGIKIWLRKIFSSIKTKQSKTKLSFLESEGLIQVSQPRTLHHQKRLMKWTMGRPSWPLPALFEPPGLVGFQAAGWCRLGPQFCGPAFSWESLNLPWQPCHPHLGPISLQKILGSWDVLASNHDKAPQVSALTQSLTHQWSPGRTKLFSRIPQYWSSIYSS